MIRIEAISSFRQLGPRNNQEDWLAPETPTTSDRVLVLCDGMGGHGHGEVASQAVAEAVYQYLTGLNCDEYTAGDVQKPLTALQKYSTATISSTTNVPWVPRW